MKKFLLIILMAFMTGFAHSQTIYYWVGSEASSNHNINTGANWNTAINGSGSSRPSSSGASDILIFDGTNLGGATTVTGPVTVNVAGGISCAQIKFVNNADISFVRPTSGTSTINFGVGDAGDDFIIEAGSKLSFVSTIGSIRMQMGAATTLRVAGTLVMNTTWQARFDNTVDGLPHTFIFESGSKFYTNITSSSTSYAFGSASQSSEKWVLFEPGAELFYDGGYSPIGNNSTFTAIDFMPGSVWHHRASNPTSGGGSFFTRRSFPKMIIENNSTLTADGPIYRIEDLTIEAGSSFVTHTSGQTVVLGNLLVNGDLTSDPTGSNRILMAGSLPQTISGTGTISIGGLHIADNANVSLQKNITVYDAVTVNGKLNLNTSTISGTGAFVARSATAATPATGNTTSGSFMITGNSAIPTTALGLGISGAGIPANTSITAFSATGDTIFLSAPATATAAAVAISAEGKPATLENNNASGFDPVAGSVQLTGNHTFEDGINYIINGATSWPFGVSTSGSASPINAAFLEVNAPVTLNRSIGLSEHLTLNGKLTVPVGGLVHLKPGAVINGSVGATNYIATNSDASTGVQAVILYEGIAGSTLIPSGTSSSYLPVTINPATSSDFTISVFQGITDNGAVNGTPFTPTQKLTVVDAVWNISRVTGSGTADLQFGWDGALEGTTFATLPGSDIGVVVNNGSAWSLPLGTGDNSANTAGATASTFGAFSISAIPQVDPFVFNPLPGKTYGDADFNGGATSLNTTQPINYSSSNPAVATIVNGDIHITGAGTTDITASQDTDGTYPAASITQQLVVSPATLTITADDQLKFEGLPNPPLTLSYSGFVLGEDATDLLTPPVVTTTALTTSPPGTYPITVNGATSNNYTITFVNGTLTIQPKQPQTITFNALPVKTYGNGDFPTGATSTNATIPITYTVSDPSVATVTGGMIHIVGAGTTSITASQAGNDGYFPAEDVVRELTVNRANLTIRVRDTTRMEGEPNPPFTITTTGFVPGETVNDLLTPLVVKTAANLSSTPGAYPLELTGGTSNNYNVTYVNGRLLVLPATGTDVPFLNAFMSNSSTLTIRIFHPSPTLADIYLFDMNGKLVLKKNIFIPEGYISNNMQVGSLPAGIYALAVRGDGVDLRMKVIIAK